MALESWHYFMKMGKWVELQLCTEVHKYEMEAGDFWFCINSSLYLLKIDRVAEFRLECDIMITPEEKSSTSIEARPSQSQPKLLASRGWLICMRIQLASFLLVAYISGSRLHPSRHVFRHSMSLLGREKLFLLNSLQSLIFSEHII